MNRPSEGFYDPMHPLAMPDPIVEAHVAFFGADNSQWYYSPQDDVTPLELASLLAIFAVMISGGTNQVDFPGMLANYKVTRHFTEAT